MKVLETKLSKKELRLKQVLLGLVEAYLIKGQPISSETIKTEGFENLSSATIRNYFAELDNEGYLKQLHTSGGRIPTSKAIKTYAKEFIGWDRLDPKDKASLDPLFELDPKEIASFLQQGAELLSQTANLAVFMSAPRFDHDFIVKLKIVPIDAKRILCVIVTDFGLIETEIFHLNQKITSFSQKRVEQYFHARLTGQKEPQELSKEEKAFADSIYNEIMVRYIVGYSHFTEEEVFKCGFSTLLDYPELHEPKALASTLALLENSHTTRKLFKDCMAKKELTFWIGEDLFPFDEKSPDCAVLLAPYKIHQQIVGAVGLVGPTRLNYKRLFALLNTFSDLASRLLTDAIFKYKIQYRQPQTSKPLYLDTQQLIMIEHKEKK
jgi:heat-inducible transcriptional repressor